MKVNAYAAAQPGARLTPFTYELGALGDHDVDVDVSHCGICLSDVSMLDNDWRITQYPFVPGHEVVGVIRAVGAHVTHLPVGQTVGVGWHSGACMTCAQCMSGDHHLCARAEDTIVGRHGGFADRLRCRGEFAIPIPPGLDASKAGPLLCGGATVFSPMVEFGIKPTDRVGVVGIGGLGHLALQFLNKWGCEVTAFSSNPGKAKAARAMGAHRVVDSLDAKAVKALAGTLDCVLVTVNVTLAWGAYLATLRPKGRLHFVGGVSEPIPVRAGGLISGETQVSGSQVGSPATIATMLEFCVRHGIEAVTESFGLSQANEALDHLRSGKARYRIVLDASR